MDHRLFRRASSGPHRGRPWIRLTQARDALVHGLRALGSYFRKYGLTIDAERRANEIVAALDRFGVLADPNSDESTAEGIAGGGGTR